MASIINGKVIAQNIRENLSHKIANYKIKTNRVPGLAVILVGDRKDSSTYVRMKKRAAESLGMNFYLERFETDVEEETLLTSINSYNNNEDVHGIIVQLPLPDHLDSKRVCATVSLNKDVDGLRSENIGKLAVYGESPSFVACTPKGCLELLKQAGVEIAGKNAVIVGRSNIVGMPVSLLLSKEDATVTICHKQTPREELIKYLRNADIVVSACGQTQMIKGDWLKKGAVVIDVGINSIDDPTKKSGYRLVGDVDFESAKESLGENGKITPVPGGVGPMTVAMLLSNTFDGFEKTLLENRT